MDFAKVSNSSSDSLLSASTTSPAVISSTDLWVALTIASPANNAPAPARAALLCFKPSMTTLPAPAKIPFSVSDAPMDLIAASTTAFSPAWSRSGFGALGILSLRLASCLMSVSASPAATPSPTPAASAAIPPTIEPMPFSTAGGVSLAASASASSLRFFAASPILSSSTFAWFTCSKRPSAHLIIRPTCPFFVAYTFKTCPTILDPLDNDFVTTLETLMESL